MFKIAIVEDQEETRESLNRFVRQYAQEQGLQVEISLITDGAEIAEHYTPGFDIIFMDVEMPRLDGFGAAEAIRSVDADVVLVFVTNMAQYAIRGYEVDALDYVLKPVNYYQFCTKLSRAIQRVQRRRGGLVLLLLWGRGDAFTLSILGENGLSINLYTILFIAFFGIGYGAYYATADMPIPMVADCSDYETYRSGKYIPGIMGTLFSLVDKLVSSLSATVVGIAVSFVGLQSLPTQYDPYTPGMNWVVIVLFCIIPMVAWAATLIAMKGYTLTGAKMKEIQAVNACRRDAVAKGMKLEEAMDKWQTMDQLPAEYRSRGPARSISHCGRLPEQKQPSILYAGKSFEKTVVFPGGAEYNKIILSGSFVVSGFRHLHSSGYTASPACLPKTGAKRCASNGKEDCEHEKYPVLWR